MKQWQLFNLLKVCLFNGSKLAVFVSAIFAAGVTLAASGTEEYKYDSIGRLKSIKYPDGKTIVYDYDQAGNRKSSGPADTLKSGQFSFVSGTHTNKGTASGMATAVIKNVGEQTISGIGFSCRAGWRQNGNAPTSLSPGQSGSYSCAVVAGNQYVVDMTLVGTGASNSPFTTPSW